jgi:hypothetical protein
MWVLKGESVTGKGGIMAFSFANCHQNKVRFAVVLEEDDEILAVKRSGSSNYESESGGYIEEEENNNARSGSALLLQVFLSCEAASDPRTVIFLSDKIDKLFLFFFLVAFPTTHHGDSKTCCGVVFPVPVHNEGGVTRGRPSWNVRHHEPICDAGKHEQRGMLSIRILMVGVLDCNTKGMCVRGVECGVQTTAQRRIAFATRGREHRY